MYSNKTFNVLVLSPSAAEEFDNCVKVVCKGRNGEFAIYHNSADLYSDIKEGHISLKLSNGSIISFISKSFSVFMNKKTCKITCDSYRRSE